MQKIVLGFSCLFLFVSVFGQTTELSVSLNSGLFSFTGRSATSSSFINVNPKAFNYTNNPYGTNPGLSYGLSASVKRVIHRHWLVGVDAGYEILRSVVHLDWVSEDGLVAYLSLPAHGQSILTSRFITAEPFVGYRLTPGKVSVDLTGGIDVARCLSAREKGKAEANNGSTYETSMDRKTISIDVRPRLQVTAGYRRAAVYVGYSLGLSNYMNGYIGGPVAEAYGRLWRFGIQYRVL